MKEERAVLAGGCFWGMHGVISTWVGYTGGGRPELPTAITEPGDRGCDRP
jgi:peptide methionine sulfoxide reductase MsrA